MEEILSVNRQEETPAEWWEGTSYEDAKAIIRSNMDNVARNSVAIGYYLRSIRDREQYREGGYQSFDAFVQAEYSMSYSAATRLIGLCERFSRGGNSPVLADTYQGYSKSLLVEMLPMSDAQLEQVQPGMTVAEVREIKREAREEAVPEPDPEPPAEEPEVVFQLAGEAEAISRQEAVARFEETMPAPVFEEDVSCQQEEAGCVHDQDGACTVLSDPDVAQPCVEGPCPAEEPVATSQAAEAQEVSWRERFQRGECPDGVSGCRRAEWGTDLDSQARQCLSNLQVEIGAKAWPAALASAKYLVHYLSLVVGEEKE